MPRHLLLCLGLCLLTAFPAMAVEGESPDLWSDTLNRELFAMEMPVRGMSMKAVRKRFGTPKAVRPPVGDPPIVRWVYDDYTVYFEGRFVIHTVVTAD